MVNRKVVAIARLSGASMLLAFVAPIASTHRPVRYSSLVEEARASPCWTQSGTRAALQEPLRFTPRDGHPVIKSITVSRSLECVAAQVYEFHIDGEDIGIEVAEETELRLVDTYSTEDDRRTLARRFEVARMSCSRDSEIDSDPDEFEVSSVSPIEGQAVIFLQDDESRRYEPTVEDPAKDVEWLVEGLVGKIEMEGFLPKEGQQLGGVWELDAQIVRQVFSPAGDLAFDCRSKELMLDTQLDENRTGTLTAHVDEAKTRSDKLTIQFSGNLASKAGTLQGIEVGQRNELVVEEAAYVHGTLTWNRAEGCFEELDLVADLSVQVIVSGPAPEGGIAFTLPGTYSFAGSSRIVAKRELE